MDSYMINSGLNLGNFLSVHAGHAALNSSEPDGKTACPDEKDSLPYCLSIKTNATYSLLV